MLVSVIIPAFNSERTVATAITSLRKQVAVDCQLEIIVVNNGSKDRTRERALQSGVKCVDVETPNRSLARNTGVLKSSGEILIFLDSDCVASENFVTTLVSVLDNEVVGAAQASVQRIIEGTNETLGIRKSLLGHAGVPFIDTCGLAVRRSVFEEVAGFNEQIVRCEDIDFSLRLIDHGYALWISTECCVDKQVGGGFLASMKSGLEHSQAFADLHSNWPEYFTLSPFEFIKANFSNFGESFSELFSAQDHIPWNRTFLKSAKAFTLAVSYPFFRLLYRLFKQHRHQSRVQHSLASKGTYLIGVDSEFALINPRREFVKELNETALLAVSNLLRGRDINNKLAAQLADYFDCQYEVIRSDLKAFWAELKQAGLLSSPG